VDRLSAEKAVSISFVPRPPSIHGYKTLSKTQDEHTLQLLQEQELQLPEQQLQAQGFMMNRCGWKEP